MTREEFEKILDEINAIKLYTEDDKTEEQISKMSGVSKGSVHTYLSIIHGIKTRPAHKRPELRNIYPVGTKFGSWTIISDEVRVGNNRALYQLCKCICGNESWKSLTSLRAGTSKKCKKCANKHFIGDNGEINVNGVVLSFFNHVKSGISKRKKVS